MPKKPLLLSESWEKITVVLLNRQVAFLDRMAVSIRLKHGRVVSRAELIRALIEATLRSGVDLSEAPNAQAMVDLLVSSVFASEAKG